MGAVFVGLNRDPSAAHAWCALRFCACISCYEIKDFLPSFFGGVLRARAEQGVTLVQTTWACECLGGSTWVDVMLISKKVTIITFRRVLECF